MDKVFNRIILPAAQAGSNERSAPANESRNLYIYIGERYGFQHETGSSAMSKATMTTQRALKSTSEPLRFPTHHRRRGTVRNVSPATRCRWRAPCRRSPPFYTIADRVIDFADSLHPTFRIIKAIAQKSPLGILIVTQIKRLPPRPQTREAA